MSTSGIEISDNIYPEKETEGVDIMRDRDSWSERIDNKMTVLSIPEPDEEERRVFALERAIAAGATTDNVIAVATTIENYLKGHAE